MLRNSLATRRNHNSNIDSTNYDNYDLNNFPFSSYSDDNVDVTTPYILCPAVLGFKPRPEPAQGWRHLVWRLSNQSTPCKL